MPVLQELRFVEIDHHSFPVAFRDLKMIAQRFVYTFDILDRREGIGRAPFYVRYVLRPQQSHGIGPFSITACTPRFLVIGFHRIGKFGMDDQPYVSLIDPHSECIGGDQHTRKSFHPIGLPLRLHNRVQAGMEIFG